MERKLILNTQCYFCISLSKVQFSKNAFNVSHTPGQLGNPKRSSFELSRELTGKKCENCVFWSSDLVVLFNDHVLITLDKLGVGCGCGNRGCAK